MKEYLETLKKVSLFKNIKENEIGNMLSCIKADIKSYKKEDIIILAGDPVKSIGIILSGNVQVVKEDSYGNRNILAYLEKTEIFAEVFACAEIEGSPISVIASSECTIMFLDFKRIVCSCESACEFHSILIQNMLRVISTKTIELNEKLSCLGKRSIEEKVRAFMLMQKERHGKDSFKISLSRAEMADYLCVDRSALSAVLSRMHQDGKINFYKNHFELLDNFFK
ncbi:Crp/Fnr family transcriptional regulator [Clostridium oryzae]|uniref:Transcriptional regulator FixK n=1 Tax=Clostridium oryzae TaxID=1450648 RepID=A0A1V4IY07_9CLOT|nr:Crp/Fnr family transcriptional regulator [Clostridium oryzae]OPJ64654.1 transcriptional regulator FixK [Clostridium oryzae]